MIFHLLYTNTEQNSCLHKLFGGLKANQVVVLVCFVATPPDCSYLR